MGCKERPSLCWVGGDGKGVSADALRVFVCSGSIPPIVDENTRDSFILSGSSTMHFCRACYRYRSSSMSWKTSCLSLFSWPLFCTHKSVVVLLYLFINGCSVHLHCNTPRSRSHALFCISLVHSLLLLFVSDSCSDVGRLWWRLVFHHCRKLKSSSW